MNHWPNFPATRIYTLSAMGSETVQPMFFPVSTNGSRIMATPTWTWMTSKSIVCTFWAGLNGPFIVLPSLWQRWQYPCGHIELQHGVWCTGSRWWPLHFQGCVVSSASPLYMWWKIIQWMYTHTHTHTHTHTYTLKFIQLVDTLPTHTLTKVQLEDTLHVPSCSSLCISPSESIMSTYV